MTLDPNAPQESKPVIRRARKGFVMLAMRTITVQATTLIAQIQLARLLKPSEFGVYGVLSFVLYFMQMFGDVGVGGALIQKKGEPTKADLDTVFTFQVATGAMLALLASLVGSFLPFIWHSLPRNAVPLMRIVALSILLDFCRAVPKINLERHLHFGRLGAVEAAQTISFAVVAVGLAKAGWGVWALGLAMLTQSIVGTTLAFTLSPYKPHIALDISLLKPLLSFGLRYQAKYVIGLINHGVTPLYAGAKLGMTSLGLIEWSQNTAFISLRIVELFSRVTFPLVSRIQHDKAAQAAVVSKNLYLAASCVFLISTLLITRGVEIIVPLYTAKWLPAVPMLHVYAMVICIGCISPIIASAMDAIGKPAYFARVALFWTVLNWVAAPIGTALGGMFGFVVGHGVHTVVGNVVVLLLAKKLLPGIVVMRGWINLVITSCFLLWLEPKVRSRLPQTYVGLVLDIILFIALFAIVLIAVGGKQWLPWRAFTRDNEAQPIQ